MAFFHAQTYLHGHRPLECHKIQANELARALNVVRAYTSDFPLSFFANTLWNGRFG